jgi:hypothetical protein
MTVLITSIFAIIWTQCIHSLICLSLLALWDDNRSALADGSSLHDWMHSAPMLSLNTKTGYSCPLLMVKVYLLLRCIRKLIHPYGLGSLI